MKYIYGLTVFYPCPCEYRYSKNIFTFSSAKSEGLVIVVQRLQKVTVFGENWPTIHLDSFLRTFRRASIITERVIIPPNIANYDCLLEYILFSVFKFLEWLKKLFPPDQRYM
jgi:hypothetical protein